MNEGEINIEGLSKAEVLAALYNGSRGQGMGALNPSSQQRMTTEQAQTIIDKRNGDLYFDYLQGRVMKVDLEGDVLKTRLYNRDVGFNAAEKIIDSMRASKTAAS